jgi:hypothetical protein
LFLPLVCKPLTIYFLHTFILDRIKSKKKITDHPRITGLDKTTPEAYSAATLARPVVAEIVAGWKENLEKPFYGITSDGTRREGVHEIVDEGAPVAEMVSWALVCMWLKRRKRELTDSCYGRGGYARGGYHQPPDSRGIRKAVASC